MTEPKFDIGTCVITKSGLKGKVIGSAEFYWGWEHRIKVNGRKRTVYKKEKELKPCKGGR